MRQENIYRKTVKWKKAKNKNYVIRLRNDYSNAQFNWSEIHPNWVEDIFAYPSDTFLAKDALTPIGLVSFILQELS